MLKEKDLTMRLVVLIASILISSPLFCMERNEPGPQQPLMSKSSVSCLKSSQRIFLPNPTAVSDRELSARSCLSLTVGIAGMTGGTIGTIFLALGTLNPWLTLGGAFCGAAAPLIGGMVYSQYYEDEVTNREIKQKKERKIRKRQELKNELLEEIRREQEESI